LETVIFLILLIKVKACYIASTLQALFMTEDFRLRILDLVEEEMNLTQFLQDHYEPKNNLAQIENKSFDLLKETEGVFYKLVASEEEAINPERFKEALPDQFRLANFEQDTLEFLLIYFDCLEMRLKGTQEKVRLSIRYS